MKNAKRNMRKNKQITAKKEKWKPQSKKTTTTRIVHPKKINHQQFDRKNNNTTTMYEPFLG